MQVWTNRKWFSKEKNSDAHRNPNLESMHGRIQEIRRERRGGPDNVLLVVVLVIDVFHRGPYVPQEAVGPKGSNRFSRGSIPVFLRKPILTCNFQGGGVRTPVPLWASPYRNAPKAEMMSMY